MTDNKELKSCPFCGGDGDNVIVTRDTSFDTHWVFCQKCKSSSGHYKTKEEAVAAWNNRVKVDE